MIDPSVTVVEGLFLLWRHAYCTIPFACVDCIHSGVLFSFPSSLSRPLSNVYSVLMAQIMAQIMAQNSHGLEQDD